MKLSYNWLKNYIDLDIEPNKLSELLTDGGLEVEGMEKIESIKGGLRGIIIGEVMTCEKHLNADKLSVTTVNIGNDNMLPIVCGAPNVAKGQKVLVATVGTTLYDGDDSFSIKKSKIRGEVSEGMICAQDEVGLGNSHDGIMVLNEQAEPGTLASDFFEIETDYIYEIGLTPNRADATSHIGSARDLVAVLNRFYPENNYSLKIPDISDFKVDNHNLPFELKVESADDCPRYTGLTLSNIKVKESPEWMQNRLKAVGLRPINNIVDITNFVLMETGQPLHAFDYDNITGKEINVKRSSRGTKFITLDEVERELSGNDIMICDAEKPMCMAGIFGGNKSGVTENTTSIFLESAYFNAVTIRKSSKYHGLKTDASFRFERGADPNITVYAIKRASELISKYADGKVSSEIKDFYPTPIENWQIPIHYKTIDKVVGNIIAVNMIRNIVTNLKMKVVSEDSEGMVLEIPTFKVDVTREIDVIEEILRVYGYNNVVTDQSIKSAISFTHKPDNEKLTNLISDFLVAKGFNEAMNNSLTRNDYYQKYDFNTENNVKILNPLSSELNAMRQNLIFGMLESAKRNINFKNKNLKVFEFGKHYSYKEDKTSRNLSRYAESKHLAILTTGDELNENWNYPTKESDFYSLKAIIIGLFNKLGIETKDLKISEENDNSFYSQSLLYKRNNKIIAEIGYLNSEILKDFEIEAPVIYADIQWDNLINLTTKYKVGFQELPKFPAVRRDLALLLDKEVSFTEVEKAAYKAEAKLLKSVNLFDIYEGKGIEEGKKSYAVSFTIQDSTKTLNDKQINKIMRKIQSNLERNLNATLR